MVEWEFIVEMVKTKTGRSLGVPGWEPISVAHGEGALGGDRFFVLLRRPR